MIVFRRHHPDLDHDCSQMPYPKAGQQWQCPGCLRWWFVIARMNRTVEWVTHGDGTRMPYPKEPYPKEA